MRKREKEKERERGGEGGGKTVSIFSPCSIMVALVQGVLKWHSPASVVVAVALASAGFAWELPPL